MNTITYSQRYLPHELNTKFFAVKLYRTGVGVSFVCRRYHISKSSLMRWNKKFDGTKESLLDKSHRPHSSIPMLIRMRNWNGFRTTTDVILKFLSVSFMANFVPIRGIPDIPAPCTVFIVVLAILVQRLLPRVNANLSLTTPQLSLESNGRWM